MTRKEILIQILSEVSGKSKSDISDLFTFFRKANPGGNWDEEIPDHKADELLDQLRAEAPGILKWLADGAAAVSGRGNETIH